LSERQAKAYRTLKTLFEKTKQRGRRVGNRVRSGTKRLKRISQFPTLGGIFLSFLKIGVVGFGGGLAVMAQIRTLVVNRRRWFTDHEFAEAFALAQSLPGTNAGNAATYIGYRLRGWRGAAVAMAGFILPSMLMMIVLAILYRHLRAFPNTERLFHGLNAAVVAVIVVAAWRIGRNTLTKPWQWYVAGLSIIAVIFFRATILEVILSAGLIGIYIDSFGEKRWQRWRRIRRLSARRRQRLAEIEEKNFVGGYLTRALAEERRHLRRLVVECALVVDTLPLATAMVGASSLSRLNNCQERAPTASIPPPGLPPIPGALRVTKSVPARGRAASIKFALSTWARLFDQTRQLYGLARDLRSSIHSLSLRVRHAAIGHEGDDSIKCTSVHERPKQSSSPKMLIRAHASSSVRGALKERSIF